MSFTSDIPSLPPFTITDTFLLPLDVDADMLQAQQLAEEYHLPDEFTFNFPGPKASTDLPFLPLFEPEPEDDTVALADVLPPPPPSSEPEDDVVALVDIPAPPPPTSDVSLDLVHVGSLGCSPEVTAAVEVLANAPPEVFQAALSAFSFGFPEPAPGPVFSPGTTAYTASSSSSSFGSPTPPPSSPPAAPVLADTRTKPKSRGDPAARVWACPAPGCEWSFARKHNLVNHMRLHEAGKETWPCTHAGCGKTFSRKYDLARHETKHTGVKAFVCACGRSFARQDKLRQHERDCAKAAAAKAP